MPHPDPIVSVCIAVRNCERYIGAAIDSLLQQSLQDFEVVICDNASTDATVTAVRSISDPRVRLYQNPANVGPCNNWNKAIHEARGRYVKLLGADDLLYPDCLRQQVAVFEADPGRSVALVCCPRDIVDSRGNIMLHARGWPTGGESLRIAGREAIRRMARAGRNTIGEPLTTMFRRDDWTRLGGFDCSVYERLPCCLDWDFWCRLLQSGDLVVNGETLGAFRVNEGSESLTRAGDYSRDDRGFISRLRDLGMADLTRFDLALGATRAWRDSWLRWAFFAYLNLRRLLRIG